MKPCVRLPCRYDRPNSDELYVMLLYYCLVWANDGRKHFTLHSELFAVSNINKMHSLCHPFNFFRACMQLWGKHSKSIESRRLCKIKASFKKQLRTCVERNLIRELCHVNDDDDDPFIVYEFVETLTGTNVLRTTLFMAALCSRCGHYIFAL